MSTKPAHRTKPNHVQLLSVPDTAAALHCSDNHVYNLIARGELRTVDIGNGHKPKSRIRSDDLQTYIEKHTAGVA